MERTLQFVIAASLGGLAAPLQLSGSVAVLTLTAGLLLIYVELNRPGSIVPGAVGLLLALLAAAAIFRLHPAPLALVLVAVAALLLLLDLRRATSPLLALGATLALILGFLRLFPEAGSRGPVVQQAASQAPGRAVGMAVAVVCGVVLGGGTSVLTRVARRARLNKGLD